MAKTPGTPNHRGRVDGKQKKKSIKANVTSKFGTKRILSRMGKKLKKGQMGPNTEFITRSTVLAKLQISLKDFRRLCILKGIYPRVPAKPPKGADKVYYDIKDISYLAHEPLLAKFREFKSFMKKIRKAAGRRQYGEARRRNEVKPVFKIDHLVKERYPRFVDALRDMDDALCMVHLFASLPSQGRVTPKRTAACKELVRQWQYYVARSRNLRKVFVSVKGIYFQSQVMGEDITWLAPHQFTQAFPREVDFRVMVTFLEFYEIFLKFALFKLFNTVGLKYPPMEDQELSAAGCLLMSVKASPLESEGIVADTQLSVMKNSTVDTTTTSTSTTSKTDNNDKPRDNSRKSKGNILASVARLATLEDKMASIVAMDEEAEADDDEDEDVDIAAPLEDALNLVGLGGEVDDAIDEEERKTFALQDGDVISQLFNGLRFFINKEISLEIMQLCVLSFGGVIGWEGPGSTFGVDDPSITHHVIDRPMQGSHGSAREYIQPQWIFDSINAQLLLPTMKYAPGVSLPPHLSPFVDDAKEGYLPQYREEIAKLKSATHVSTTGDNGGDDNDEEEEEEQTDYAAEVRAEREGKSFSNKKNVTPESLDDEDEDNEEEEEEEEVIKETSSKKGPKAVVYAPEEPDVTEDQEEAALSRIMMSKKTKRLYGRMQHGIEKKKTHTQSLLDKRASKQEEELEVVVPVAAATTPSEKKSKRKNTSSPAATTPIKKKKKGIIKSSEHTESEILMIWRCGVPWEAYAIKSHKNNDLHTTYTLLTNHP
eukprot:gene4184-8320_t